MSKTILVTGATGNLGGAVAEALAARGFRVKAASRHPEKVAAKAAVEAVALDFEDPNTFDGALAGVEGAFLIAPPMDPEAPAKLKPLIEKAKTAGIGHVVFTSALGVDQNEQAPLRVIERALMTSGIRYTILRPNFFMENFSTGFVAPMIKHNGGIFLAAGDAKTSFISTRDIAEVAAIAFAAQHHGKEYNLTGPEALDHTQAAGLISEAVQKEIAYHALAEEAMLQGARDNGMPEPAVQYMAVLYAVVRAGYMAAVTDDVERVTGHKPVTFAEFVRANVKCWKTGQS
jgi:uncharacterized protein YbjT (DUF2867 family)